MKVIGLVGGIASGKSAVASELAKLGAVVFDADKMAHAALDDPAVQTELVARWGDGILSSTGKVQRQAVAKKIFGQHPKTVKEREFLESLLHPRIRSEVESQLAALENHEGVARPPAAVIDAPLLLEAGWKSICDAIIFVETSEPTRRERAEERGWSEEEIARRESAQMPIQEKRDSATHVLDNNGTTADLAREVSKVWSQIVGSG